MGSRRGVNTFGVQLLLRKHLPCTHITTPLPHQLQSCQECPVDAGFPDPVRPHRIHLGYLLLQLHVWCLSMPHGVYQCRGDISLEQCSSCISDALNVEFVCDRWRVQLTGCFVRYDWVSFFNTGDGSTFWNGSCAVGTDSRALFQSYIQLALDTVKTRCSENGGFYATRVGTDDTTVYALSQCVAYFTPDMCTDCIDQAISYYYQNCGPDSSGGFVYVGSCSCIVSKTSSFLFDASVVVALPLDGVPSSPPLPSSEAPPHSDDQPPPSSTPLPDAPLSPPQLAPNSPDSAPPRHPRRHRPLLSHHLLHVTRLLGKKL